MVAIKEDTSTTVKDIASTIKDIASAIVKE